MKNVSKDLDTEAEHQFNSGTNCGPAKAVWPMWDALIDATYYGLSMQMREILILHARGWRSSQ